MAQAPPQGPTGAPRQNKTVKEFKGMNTQNRRNAIPEGSFAWLENIQPIGPGHLHSIPGRSTSVVRIPPIPPQACPDAAPGAQALDVVCCYDSNGFGSLSTNNNGGLTFVNAGGNFWHIATENSGFSSGPYPIATPNQTWYLLEPINPDANASPLDCGLQEVTAIPLPGGKTANFSSTQTPQGGDCSTSDERSYVIDLININPVLSGVGGNTAAKCYFGENSGVAFMNSSLNKGFGQVWTKSGNFFYSMITGFASNDKEFGRWPVPAPNGTYEDLTVPMETMLPGWDDDTTGFTSIWWMHCTSAHIYILALAPFDGGANRYRIYKILKNTLTYVTHWELSADPNFPEPWAFSAFNDDLLFLIKGGGVGNWTIGNFHTASGTTDVIGTVPIQCVGAGNGIGQVGNSGFFYAMNYYYLSYAGFGIGVTNVLKVGPLFCPSGSPGIPWQSE